ncbi:MAG: TRAP transporter large permease subunit [SAR202 cluster bacterium]|jgi:TRAP-type C4-dicarboxylate transport system permease large subunit|nr:TRAP transporter large permease subunit [Dehalococcoidia bacterium]MQF87471.1 TRAP transporter large permease subunit [SAR202 cluster bacterium]|tara:strand:+ start:22203 stop:23684 length:1482 start_codon:yes stop_codon:yes gene_type:complete
MAITAAFSMMSAFFMGGLYVSGALGVIALLLMKFFNIANPNLWNIMGNRAWEGSTNFTLIAIPLFILMGELVLRSGIAERMYNVLSRWLVFIPGGLIHSNIASCAVFAACAGSSVATAATISRVALPAFRQRGYNERLVIGSLAAGGTLGILIPPSIGLVLYGLIVGESIGRLFLAGFIPGVILAITFMLMIGIASKIWPGIAPKEEMVTWRLRFAGLVSLLPIGLLIFAVLGSIYFGIATPTEAAAAGVTGALFLTLAGNSGMLAISLVAGLVRRFPLLPRAVKTVLDDFRSARPVLPGQVRHNVNSMVNILKESFLSTARTSAMILLILMAAFTLQFAFAAVRISVDMAEWVAAFELTQLQLILVLVVFYLVLGTFMESYSMMLTTLPILIPVLNDANVDKVWFGIIMVILLEAAQISPPQGMALYVLQGARRDTDRELAEYEGVLANTGTINDVFMGVMPFMLCMFVVIGLVIAFPELAIWLPDQAKGGR